MVQSALGMLLRAYIDPAATSILLSSITAIVVAVGATFIVLWRKFKKGVSKALHIDPNAGKEVEDDLVINDDTANGEGATREEATAEAAATESEQVAENAQAAEAEKAQESEDTARADAATEKESE